jgi:hypothetical protein
VVLVMGWGDKYDLLDPTLDRHSAGAVGAARSTHISGGG